MSEIGNFSLYLSGKINQTITEKFTIMATKKAPREQKEREKYLSFFLLDEDKKDFLHLHRYKSKASLVYSLMEMQGFWNLYITTVKDHREELKGSQELIKLLTKHIEHQEEIIKLLRTQIKIIKSDYQPMGQNLNN